MHHTATRPFPELALVGAARSGTSFLAAHLAQHPRIDAPGVKEPNFFSQHYDKGLDYYDGFFPAHACGHVRMDASTSYTFPHYPDALPRLAARAPAATIVYVVRDPLERAHSHYRHNRHYFQTERADDFGTALRDTPVFLGASDYGHWLSTLRELFGSERVLTVPFGVVEARCADVAAVICRRLGLDPTEHPGNADVAAYQNTVVTFRHGLLRSAADRVRRSARYPTLRRAIGPARIRRVRSLLTTQVHQPSLADELAGCDPDQLTEICQRASDARAAVDTALTEQDDRLGLDWRACWKDHGGSTPLAG